MILIWTAIKFTTHPSIEKKDFKKDFGNDLLKNVKSMFENNDFNNTKTNELTNYTNYIQEKVSFLI